VKCVLHTTRPPGRTLELEADLNPEQRAVVTAPEGPMLVIAGAGSGKTRALTYRVAWLLQQGVPPDRLLLCTFTNRAGREMVRRIQDLCGIETRSLFAGTFHHVAHRLVRRHHGRLGLPEGFRILDREDARELLRDCLVDEGSTVLREQRLPQPKVLQSLLSRALNSGVPLGEMIAREAPRLADTHEILLRVANRFAGRKATMGMLDFDDLLLLWKALLTEHAEVGAELRDRFQYVLCDEYQDTSRLQGELVDLTAEGHRNLMVVGDDAQSIYSFRGADFRNILDFPRRHPDARICRLETNYRSTPEVLNLANLSILHNTRQHPKILRAACASGEMPAVVPVEDVYQQAEFVAQRLLELHQVEGMPLGDIAILYRNHAHALELQVELTRRKIPYQVRSGLRFFEQAHIKDVVAYLRAVTNPQDGLAWSRMLRLYAGIGDRSARRVVERAARTTLSAERLLHELMSELPSSARPPASLLAELLGRMQDEPSDAASVIARVLDGHYADYAVTAFPNANARLEDLKQLAEYAGRFANLPAFLAELSLVASVATESVSPGESPEERVTLSTIHQAKGLEWSCVFVIWLSEGRFPHVQSLRTPGGDDEEEERRLFHVAVTRARRHLHLCHPQWVEDARGLRAMLRASRFIRELDGANAPFDRWEIRAEP
jgi:DNA helicase-2/ATP-dependent DNA helicase PcrA